MQIHLLEVILMTILIEDTITGTKACDNSICLSWTMKTHQLKLICKIRYLHFSVKILNPSGDEEAYCFSPVQHPKCYNFSGGIVNQNLKTNETIATFFDINSRFNGNWTCLHGSGSGSASTEVFLTSLNGLIEENEKTCVSEFLSWTIAGLVPTFMILRIGSWLYFTKDNNLYQTCLSCVKCKKIKDNRKKTVCKIIVYISVILYLIGLPLVIGFLERRNCIAAEAFMLVGALIAVTFNLMLNNRNESLSNRHEAGAFDQEETIQLERRDSVQNDT